MAKEKEYLRLNYYKKYVFSEGGLLKVMLIIGKGRKLGEKQKDQMIDRWCVIYIQHGGDQRTH